MFHTYGSVVAVRLPVQSACDRNLMISIAMVADRRHVTSRHTQATLANSNNNSAFTVEIGTYQVVQRLEVGFWTAWVLVKFF